MPAAAPPIANTSVNERRTSIPSAVTIERFSTPARMIMPYRVFCRNSTRAASTRTAAIMSTQ